MNRHHRADYEDVRARLTATERHVEQLRNTLRAVARDATDVSVAHPCQRCERSLLLVRAGQMYCPNCGYERSV
jgi:exosome complex RNA-binding protein Csl4